MWCGNSQIARLGTCISKNCLKQALILGPIRCVQLTQWTLLDQMWVLTIMMLVQYWRELRWWSIIQRVPYGLSLFHLTKVTRLPQYKDCLTGYAIFLYCTTLKLLRFNSNWSRWFPGFKTTIFEYNKVLVFWDELRTMYRIFHYFGNEFVLHEIGYHQ